MNSDLFVKVAMCIISLICALISAYVIPYIKTKAKAADLDKLMEFARIAVRCANQIYTPDQWLDKKNYVVNQVQAFILANLKIELSEDQIDTIIEGLVNEVKKMDKDNN